ncbi:MAG: dienelactone hydrolase family protein [Chloroflexota bacterium]
MCFDLDSRPPIQPIMGGALDGGPFTLDSDDGASILAFRARAAHPSGAGILILPDVRGLHAYYEELALRYAEHGVDAVAIDYFGRTAGLGSRGDDFDYSPHVGLTRWETLAADIRAGAAALRAIRSPSDGAGSGLGQGDGPGTGVGVGVGVGARSGPERIFVTGFCMGGRLSFVSGTLDLDLAGIIGFYGWPTGASGNGTPAPADVAAAIKAPVLAIYGGADTAIGPEVRDAFDQALDAAGVERRTVTYAGAPHSFFDRKASDHADASAAAWNEVTTFIERLSA